MLDPAEDMIRRHLKRMRKIDEADAINTAKLASSHTEMVFEQAQVDRTLSTRSRDLAEELFNAVFRRNRESDGGG